MTLVVPLQSTDVIESDKERMPNKSVGVSGLSVLAAEDVEINRMILQDLLENAGMRVSFAHDGQQAVDMALADDASFDVVLMDIQMPRIDGYEATRRILQAGSKLPIVGLTAHALQEERDKCLSVGMSGHVRACCQANRPGPADSAD